VTHEDALRVGEECRQAALNCLRLGLTGLPACPPAHVGVGKKHNMECKSHCKAPLVKWKLYQDGNRVRTSCERQIDDIQKVGDVKGLHQWLADRRRSGGRQSSRKDFVVSSQRQETGVNGRRC